MLPFRLLLKGDACLLKLFRHLVSICSLAVELYCIFVLVAKQPPLFQRSLKIGPRQTQSSSYSALPISTHLSLFHQTITCADYHIRARNQKRKGKTQKKTKPID